MHLARPGRMSAHGVDDDGERRPGPGLDQSGRLIVHAIEAADLTQGAGLTPPVAAAIDDVASAVLRDIRDGSSRA